MIPLTIVELEHWDGPFNENERFTPASLDELRELASRLDGQKTDSLSIEIEGVGRLCLGGGPKHFVAVSFPIDGSSSHIEIDGTLPGKTEVQVGGQSGFYSNRMVMPLDTALKIAESFISKQGFDPALNWVEDCPPGTMT